MRDYYHDHVAGADYVQASQRQARQRREEYLRSIYVQARKRREEYLSSIRSEARDQAALFGRENGVDYSYY